MLVRAGMRDPEGVFADPVTTGRAHEHAMVWRSGVAACGRAALALAIEQHGTSVECQAMAISDRILPLCDLLLAAAYADQQLAPEEREEVRAVISDIAGGLSSDALARLESFDASKFDLAATASAFRGDSEDDRRKLLFLVSAVIEADNEIDLAEDDFLRALASALELPASALEGLTVEIEAEDLKDVFQAVRKTPPPPPAKLKSVDVDLD